MDASDVDGINASLIGASFLPYWPSLCSFQSLKWFELVGKAKCGFKSTVKRCKIYCEIYLRDVLLKKKTAVLLGFVQMRGGGPCPNFLSTFHKLFIGSIWG